MQCARIQSSRSGPTQQEILDEWEASGFASVYVDQGEVGPLTHGVEGHQEERVAALQMDNDIATLQRRSPGAAGQIYRAIESGQQISQAELDEGD